MYSRAVRSRSAFEPPTDSSGNTMFPSTVRHGSRRKSWNTTARSRPGPSIGVPLTRICPPEIGSRPSMHLSSVVLPQPLGPIRLRNSPRGTRSETSSSASSGALFDFLPPS